MIPQNQRQFYIRIKNINISHKLFIFYSFICRIILEKSNYWKKSNNFFDHEKSFFILFRWYNFVWNIFLMLSFLSRYSNYFNLMPHSIHVYLFGGQFKRHDFLLDLISNKLLQLYHKEHIISSNLLKCKPVEEKISPLTLQNWGALSP